MIQIIIALLLLAYLLSGYSKKRRLDVVVGNIYYIGINERAIFYIYVNKYLSWILSSIPLPKPFKRICPTLEWWEWVDGKNKMQDRIVIGKKIENEKEVLITKEKYEQIREYETGFMGLRKEKVPSFRRFEHVDYDMTLMTGDGYKMIFILSFTYKIFKPMEVLYIPHFKMLGYDLTLAKLQPIVFSKTIGGVYEIDIDTLSNVKVGDETLEQYLDRVHFNPVGFDLYKKGMKIHPGPEAKKYFALVNEKELEQKRGELAEVTGITREKERVVELADANQNITIMENMMAAANDKMQDVLFHIYEGKRNEKSAHPFVLAEVNHQVDEVGEEALKTYKEFVLTFSKTTSSEKFKKAEVNSEN